MRTSKLGVLNVQCRSVVMASKVRSTFASLVKSKPVPAFIGKVRFDLSPNLSMFSDYFV